MIGTLRKFFGKSNNRKKKDEEKGKDDRHYGGFNRKNWATQTQKSWHVATPRSSHPSQRQSEHHILHEEIALTHFPFEKLPVECKILIFQFLSDFEKCKAALVCKVWAEIIRTPSLWPNADFTLLVPGCTCFGPGAGFPCDRCYVKQRKEQKMLARMLDYGSHLVYRRCQFKTLRFNIDLSGHDNEFVRAIMAAIDNESSRNLRTVDCCWHKVDWFEKRGLSSKDNKVKTFHQFLFKLFLTSPNIHTFRMQFDWSKESVKLLSSFQNIHTLHLHRYWVLKNKFSQKQLDTLLKQLPQLEKFTLDVVVPVVPGRVHPQFSISSESIKFLDVCECRHFFFSNVDLPNLQHLKVARQPWAGPLLGMPDLNIRCLYEILKDGAPCLKRLRNYSLNDDWKEKRDPDMYFELFHCCYCNRHRGRWGSF